MICLDQNKLFKHLCTVDFVNALNYQKVGEPHVMYNYLSSCILNRFWAQYPCILIFVSYEESKSYIGEGCLPWFSSETQPILGIYQVTSITLYFMQGMVLSGKALIDCK